MAKRKKKKRKEKKVRNKKKKIKRKVRRKKIKSSKKKKIFKIKLPKESKDSDGNLVFRVPENWSKQAYVNKTKYEKKYKLSIKNNDDFWKKEGKRITWINPYSKIKDVKYSKKEVNIRWYYYGTLNASPDSRHPAFV